MWTHTGPHGPMWAHIGPIWAHIDPCGPIWARPGPLLRGGAQPGPLLIGETPHRMSTFLQAKLDLNETSDKYLMTSLRSPLDRHHPWSTRHSATLQDRGNPWDITSRTVARRQQTQYKAQEICFSLLRLLQILQQIHKDLSSNGFIRIPLRDATSRSFN